MADGIDFTGGAGNFGFGGGLNNLMFMDPAMSAAMRRQLYGQQLMSMGSETTPVRSGWQAFARAVQGTLGGYEMRSGMDAMSAAQQRMQQEAMAQAQQDADLIRQGMQGGAQPPAQYTPQPQSQPPAGGGASAAPTAITPFVGSNLPQGVTPEEDQRVRTIIGEAANQPQAGQAAVNAVISNRMRAGNESAEQTIFRRNAFEPWNNPTTRAGLQAIDPTSPQYQGILNNVVRPMAAGSMQDPTGGATYFVNPVLQSQLGRQQPSWATGNRTTIGAHDFYYGPYSGAGGATASSGGTQGPLIIGDSIASKPGLGGTGVVSAQPSAIRAQIATDARNGAYQGRDVVLSSGASNAPGDMTNIEAQLAALKQGGAGNVSLMGVGPGIESTNPGTNAALEALAKKYGATFTPLPADQMSPDGKHPTAQGYAALRDQLGLGQSYQTASSAAQGPPGGPPSTAQPGSVPGVPGTQFSGGQGFQMAQALLQRAQAEEMSLNPMTRMHGQQLRQQAMTFMQMGAWGDPQAVPGAPGQYYIRNQLNGETKFLGSPQTLTKDAAGNLVNAAGQVVDANRGWTKIKDVPNGEIWQDPTGKPSMLTLPGLERPDAQIQNTMNTLGAKWQQDPNSLTPQEKLQLANAISTRYPTKTEIDPKTGISRTYQPTAQPSGLPSVEQLFSGQPTAPGAGPAAPSAAAATGGVTTAAPPAGQPTPLGVEAATNIGAKQIGTDIDMADKFREQATQGDQTLGLTQQIRGLLASGKVPTGAAFEVQKAIGQIMAAGGYSPATIERATQGMNPSDAEYLQKLLVQFSTQATRAMGAREPGSVLQMFMKNYPNPTSRPETIDEFTRGMDMQVLYDKQRAALMQGWIDQNRGNPSAYKSLNSPEFNTWVKAQGLDPRIYSSAALAAAGQPHKVWANGLGSNQEVDAAKALARQTYPSVRILPPESLQQQQQGAF
jgi:spore germination cell wall hydrolase CwlJ-like protein